MPIFTAVAAATLATVGITSIRPSIDESSQMQFPRDGLLLLERQYAAKCHRATEGTFGGTTVGGLVGGFAQHTQVDADGIRIKVLKRWSDKL